MLRLIRAFPAFAFIAAIALGTLDAHAEPLAPIYVTVVGQGAVRVLLAAGVVAPCDSSDNEPVYDGWLAPGRYRFYLASRSVCMQHTFGEFRDAGGAWSTPAILPTAFARRRRGQLVPFEIRISTDAPYA